MEQNDITLRPAKPTKLTRRSAFCYGYSPDKPYSSVRRTVVRILRAPPVSTTLWPGEYLEVLAHQGIPYDADVAIETRSDVDGQLGSWLQPDVISSAP